MPIRKRFVAVGDRLVHYRTAGEGPPAVLLHDSPRSSALHLPLIESLSDAFTVIALDTPGYGHSDPLSGGPFEIADFSRALGEALDALGVRRAGFYAFHTGSKILLDFAIRCPERVSVAILDGLSIPLGGPDASHIARYMRPFLLDEDGAYVAREWTRLRDSSRWFPWFDRRTQTRIAGSPQTPEQLHQSFLDYFNSGPHYSDAYRAAMFYEAAPQLAHLRAPTVIMARSDDVLYSHLDRLPDLPDCCRVERLGPDRETWRSRVRSILADHVDSPPCSPQRSRHDLAHASAYLDLPHGQVRVRRLGSGRAPPILYLHETPGGAGAAADELDALAQGRALLAPDLPGCGESDPLVDRSADGYAAVLQAVTAVSGSLTIDLIAEATATPLALRLMARNPGLVRRAALDAVLLPDAAERSALASAYCPQLDFESCGAHLHRAWQMIRDQAVQWPWYDGSAAAIRRFPGSLDAPRLNRRFLDVLAQMEHYGDAVAAALAADARSDLKAVIAPILVFESDDPRDRWARTASELCGSVELTPRPADRGEAVRRVLAFLDRP